MKYHIDTGFIDETFSHDTECPLCEIRKKEEEQFLHEYLNDGVTDDETRKKVNDRGFCEKHYAKLFRRPNKLSLALQIGTRMETVRNRIGTPTDGKSAEKCAEEIGKGNPCVVCDELSESMHRYYVSVAEMAAKYPEFFLKIQNGKGFCLPHYAELLKESKYAGAMQKEYVKMLASVEDRALTRLEKERKWFCDKHDYRNRLLPLGTSEDVLQRLYQKIYGRFLDEE